MLRQHGNSPGAQMTQPVVTARHRDFRRRFAGANAAGNGRQDFKSDQIGSEQRASAVHEFKGRIRTRFGEIPFRRNIGIHDDHPRLSLSSRMILALSEKAPYLERSSASPARISLAI